MAGEEIQLNLAVPEAFFQELDRRFDALAKRATQSFNNAARAQGGAPSSGGGAAPGGGGGGMAGAVEGALGEGLGAAGGALLSLGADVLGGARQGLRNTRGAAASSSTVLADNAITGAASSFVENTVGRVPILGDIIVAQMNAAKDAIEIPRDRATARLQGIYGNLAKAGYQASDEELGSALDFQNELEKRSYEAEQRIDRLNREQHPTSAAFGLNWNGS